MFGEATGAPEEESILPFRMIRWNPDTFLDDRSHFPSTIFDSLFGRQTYRSICVKRSRKRPSSFLPHIGRPGRPILRAHIM